MKYSNYRCAITFSTRYVINTNTRAHIVGVQSRLVLAIPPIQTHARIHITHKQLV